MWFTHRAWIPVAWLLFLGNVVAVWFAAQPAEPWHATSHAVAAVLFAVGARRLMARRRSPIDEGRSIDQTRFDQLQQSVDVIALEVERISEGQRFVAKILTEQQSVGPGETRPIAGDRKDVVPARARSEEPPR